MARTQKPVRNPQTPRSPDQPARFSDFTAGEQDAAGRQLRQFGDTLSDRMGETADQLESRPTSDASTARVTRLRAASEDANQRPVTIPQAARNRVELIEQAVQQNLRMPGESVIPGAGWYFDAAREEAEVAPNTPARQRSVASSIMSPGTQPAAERRALGALDTAEQTGRVGDRDFRDIPGEEVARAVKPGARPAAENVDWTALSGPQAPNVGRAHDIMRGAQDPATAQSPQSSPKTWDYTENKVLAAEALGGPVEGEYRRRAGVLGDKIAGNVGVGQTSLDLYGLAQSDEGILDPQGPTAEDSWMQAINVRHKFTPGAGTAKAAGDVPYQQGKSHERETARGRVVDQIAPRDPSVSAENIRHATSHAATVEAGRMLAEKYETAHPDDSGGFELPSVLVQETPWTSVKRQEPAVLGRNPGTSPSDAKYGMHVKAQNSPTPRARDRVFPGSTKW